MEHFQICENTRTEHAIIKQYFGCNFLNKYSNRSRSFIKLVVDSIRIILKGTRRANVRIILHRYNLEKMLTRAAFELSSPFRMTR